MDMDKFKLGSGKLERLMASLERQLSKFETQKTAEFKLGRQYYLKDNQLETKEETKSAEI